MKDCTIHLVLLATSKFNQESVKSGLTLLDLLQHTEIPEHDLISSDKIFSMDVQRELLTSFRAENPGTKNQGAQSSCMPQKCVIDIQQLTPPKEHEQNSFVIPVFCVFHQHHPAGNFGSQTFRITLSQSIERGRLPSFYRV